MPLTKARHRMIKGAPLNVVDWETVGDGVADDTTKVAAAVAAAFASGLSGAKAAGEGSHASGAGGRLLSELCGRKWLYSQRQFSIKTFASASVSKISPFKSSSRSLPLKDSL